MWAAAEAEYTFAQHAGITGVITDHEFGPIIGLTTDHTRMRRQATTVTTKRQGTIITRIATRPTFTNLLVWG